MGAAKLNTSEGSRFGVVVIGRNEGARLRACLRSVSGQAAAVIYVDSGSTDGSVQFARSMNFEPVELDMSIPFTAARARNEGFSRLIGSTQGIDYVQFVDGDCEVVEGWLEQAVRYLDDNPGIAAVCGRRRERFPEHSIYNLLCDIEWDTPIGIAAACGGDVMMRIDALKGSGGYRADLIAGEEPELCLRLRVAGWRIWRLDAEMTLHDAAITRFGQWWTRTLRSGYAFAENAYLHRASRSRHYVRESQRAWVWGILMPLLILSMSTMEPVALGLILLYPLQVLRIAISLGPASKANWWRSFFLVLGRFPEAFGQLRFLRNRLRASPGELIEYK